MPIAHLITCRFPPPTFDFVQILFEFPRIRVICFLISILSIYLFTFFFFFVAKLVSLISRSYDRCKARRFIRKDTIDRIESSTRTNQHWRDTSVGLFFFSFFFFHIPPKHPAFNRGFSTPPGYQKAYMKRQYLLDLTERLLLLSPRFSARLFAKAAREIPSRYSEPSWWYFVARATLLFARLKKYAWLVNLYKIEGKVLPLFFFSFFLFQKGGRVNNGYTPRRFPLVALLGHGTPRTPATSINLLPLFPSISVRFVPSKAFKFFAYRELYLLSPQRRFFLNFKLD